MRKTPFTCPKCGNDASFTAYGIAFYGACHIAEDGWDYWTEGGDVTLLDHALMECDECHHKAVYAEFEEV